MGDQSESLVYSGGRSFQILLPASICQINELILLCSDRHSPISLFFADLRVHMPDYSRLLIRFVQSTLTEMDRSRGSQGGAKKPKHAEHPTDKIPAGDVRRTFAGGLSVTLLCASAFAYATSWLADWTGSQSTSDFIVSAMTRIGLVIGAIWLAWDSMRRPARWIPPGLAVAGVVGIVVVAAQPKLIFAIVPLLGGLAVFTSVVRVLRRR